MKKFFKGLISIIILIAPAFYFGFVDKTAQMWSIVVPSILSAVIINLEELKQAISSIKTKNLEIKFNDAIDRAYATIEQMNKTQFVLTKVTTEILHSHKYWGGCTVESSLDTVDELYELAEKSGLKEIINGPIKLAYERIIGEAFTDLTEDVNDSEGAKKINPIIHSNYTAKRDNNIFIDGKYIPSVSALTELVKQLDIPDVGQEKIKKNLSGYDRAITTYQKIFGKIKLNENIPIINKEETP